MILGIDPGLKGALAFYDHDAGTVSVADMPVAYDQLDAYNLAFMVKSVGPSIAIIESVGARPGQGVSSMFKFGRGYGTVIGVVAALEIPMEFVSPGRWKKHYRLPADKEAARSLAIQLWPKAADRFKRKMDAGRAEAALIARFYAEMRRK